MVIFDILHYIEDMEKLGLKHLFESGAYQAVLTLHEKGSTLPIHDGFEFIMGAMVFTGKLKEAQLIYDQASPHAPPLAALIKARFFLGVGYASLSDYGAARTYFGQNLKSDHPGLLPQEKFFIYQGMAFFRFLCCRFARANHWGHQSWAAAVTARYNWGRSLAADLLGHALFRTGNKSQGIRSLEEANEFALKLHNNALSSMMNTALLIYKSIGGFLSLVEQDNEFLLNNLTTEMTDVVQSANCLERARILSLRGQVKESLNVLKGISPIIHGSGHKRNLATLNLRYAYNHFLSGQWDLSLGVINEALKHLDPTVERLLELSLLGLKLRILKAQGKPCDQLKKRVHALTYFTGTGIAERILRREFGTSNHNTLPGTDPMGDLQDAVRREDQTKIQKVTMIVESGYLSLLHLALDIAPGTIGLYFDILPSRLLIIDQGNLTWIDQGVTPAIRQFFQCLEQGHQSKETLTQQIWGYQYNQLKHDQLIYNLVSRARQLLGEQSTWLTTSDLSYSLHQQVDVKFFGQNITAPKAPFEHSMKHQGLNIRQLGILEDLKTINRTDAQTCAERFKVSLVTARRDLSLLTRLSLLKRVGKGRATVYLLPDFGL